MRLAAWESHKVDPDDETDDTDLDDDERARWVALFVLSCLGMLLLGLAIGYVIDWARGVGFK